MSNNNVNVQDGIRKGIVNYTSRDYESLLEDFKTAVSSLTELWKPEAEADPGMVLAKYIAQVLCISVSVTYIIFVLKVDMGDRIHMVYLSSAIGSLVGITMGFFVGSIGRMSESVKVAVIMTVSMSASFLSGLMIGNMKAVLAKRAPIVNELNPAAMISDMFYCLNIYTDYERYTEKVISILILSAVFTIGGYFMTRRKKYASL